MNTPPRVLHVVESWPPVASGYANRSAWIIDGQSRLDISSPSVLVSSRQSVYPDTACTREPQSYTQSVLVPSDAETRIRSSSSSWLQRPFHVDGAHLQRAVEEQAEHHDAQLIHVHWSSTIGTACLQAARKLQLPLVAEVRFDLAAAANAQSARGMATVFEPVARRWFERHLRGADAIVSASDALSHLLRRSLPASGTPLYTVPNGVDESFLQRCREAQALKAAPEIHESSSGSNLHQLVIGTTSKMLRYENLQSLLGLLDALPNAHLRFIGDGPERARIEQLAGKYASEHQARIEFRGVVPHTDIPTQLVDIDLFVVPRRLAAITRYASPIKVVEAMAAGCAVVATQVGDTAMLLAEGRGKLVPPGDERVFTEAVIELASDANQRLSMGQAAQNYASSVLNSDEFLRRYSMVYGNLNV